MLEIKVNNGKVSVRGESNLIGVCADLCTVIDFIHTELTAQDPILGKAFRYALTTALDDKGTPLWSGNTAAMAGAQVVFGQEKEKRRPDAGTSKAAR